jgi:pimeloyl-ACP methyl ester carboxylesterase
VIGAVNGVLGGELDERRSPLAVRMSLRADGQLVTPTPRGLAEAYPDATRRIVVFAHGLCETEDAWRLNALEHHGDPTSTHGARLRADLGYSPVYLRYNTGRHISDNGRQFSDLLERLVSSWPVEVEEVVLVGHSMGGLVIRSACHAAEQTGASWVSRVQHMLYLGSPHFGAPLAQLVHVGSWGLAKLPETAPVANLLNRRSYGIRDLRHGTIVEADWMDLDPDALRGHRPSDVPLLPKATHYYIGATITRDKGHPVGRILGDSLVQFPSASGATKKRRLQFEVENGRHVGGLNHMDLLNHPLVYEHIRTWLEVAPRDVEEAMDKIEDLPEHD